MKQYSAGTVIFVGVTGGLVLIVLSQSGMKVVLFTGFVTLVLTFLLKKFLKSS